MKIIHKGQEMKKIQGLEVKVFAFEDGVGALKQFVIWSFKVFGN